MQVLVPLKDFVQAKQRLSGVLTPVERRGLVQAMVNDVLTVLADLPNATVTLLSDDPSANLLAEHYGMRHWSERELLRGARGLNAVVKAGLHALNNAVEPADSVMILHGDLPLLSGEELNQLCAAHGSPSLTASGVTQLTVATDRHHRGSNIVLLTNAEGFEPRYGENSLEHHLAQYDSARSVFLPRASRDIDSAQDLFELFEPRWSADAPHTQNWLRDAGVARRLRTIAASGGLGNNDLTGIASE